MIKNSSRQINVIFLFFEDDFYKWPLRNKLESFVKTNSDVTIVGVTFPVSILTLFSKPRRFIKFLFNPNKKIQQGIYSITPFTIFPLRLINKNRILIEIHKWILDGQINNFLNHVKAMENRLTWIYHLAAFPVFFDIVKQSRLLIYQCEDDNIMKENTVCEDMKEMEDDLLSKANIVFAASSNVYYSRREKNKNCFLIPNAVDFKFFSKADSPDIPSCPELKDIPKPIVGYLGIVRSWLDFELIEFLADKLPNASFIFVGPIADDVRDNVAALKARPNVYFIKRKDREELLPVLKAFDVCAIPFKYNKFNLATNPLKFWEYLATGRPILTLRIPDFEIYEKLLYMYVNKEEALEKMLAALQENDPGLKERRMEIAKKNDLSLRSSRYHEIIMRYLPENT